MTGKIQEHTQVGNENKTAFQVQYNLAYFFYYFVLILIVSIIFHYRFS